jgi:hypothetical protein
LEADFMQEAYKSALIGLEKGRVEATRILKKVLVLQSATLPEYPLRPRRLYNIATFLIGALLLAGLIHLLVAIVRDHRDCPPVLQFPDIHHASFDCQLLFQFGGLARRRRATSCPDQLEPLSTGTGIGAQRHRRRLQKPATRRLCVWGTQCARGSCGHAGSRSAAGASERRLHSQSQQ